MKHGKIDINQKRIVSELRREGFSAFSIADLKNCCDLIVTDGDKIILVEIKNPDYCNKIAFMDQDQRFEFLTKGEKIFSESFKVFIAISAEEIIDQFKN